MKKLCVVLMSVMMLAGCGGKEKQVICTETLDGDDFIYEFNAKGDKLNTHTIKITADLAEWELTEDDLSDAKIATTKELLDGYYIEDYKDLKGVTVSSSFEENNTKYLATVSIDFNQVDFDELEKVGLVESGTEEISLEMTLEDYENCTEKEL